MILKDLRYGLRSLSRRPTFTLIALLTLAIGIGATTSMFTLVNSVLLKPLPYPDSHELVTLVRQNTAKPGLGSQSHDFKTFVEWRKANTQFQALSFWAYDQFTYTQNDQHEPLSAHITSTDFFSVFNVPPLMGRWYDKSDLGKRVVVLSHHAWLTHFQSAQNIVGRTITLDKEPALVIGVMPEGFITNDDQSVKLWSLIDSLGRPGNVIGRLKTGISLEQAQQQASVLERIVNERRGSTDALYKIDIVSIVDSLTKDSKQGLVLLMAAVIAVFLIAVLNVVNLTFAHYANRTQELAVRVSVGASRYRLLRQLMVESLLLSVCGGILGLLIAAWGVELILYALPNSMPRVDEIALDLNAMLVTFGLSIIAGVIASLLPAYTLVNPKKLGALIKQAGQQTTGNKQSHKIRRGLVSLEVGVAVILLIGAGLLLRSYSTLLNQEPGFNSDNIMTGHIWLPNNYQRGQYLPYWNQLITKLEQHPAVESAAATTTLPMKRHGIDYNVNYTFSGAPEFLPGEAPEAAIRSVTTNYFNTLQIPLLEGRHFDDRDRSDASLTVIINRELADRLWPDESPVGRELILTSGGANNHLRIIGVVSNVKHKSLSSGPQPEFYIHHEQGTYVGMTVFIRAKGSNLNNLQKAQKNDPAALAKILTNVVAEIDASVPLINILSLEEATINTLQEQRLLMLILVIFSVIALVLASIGVYGISDNMVAQRTNEIGIRIAIGARPKAILRWIVWDTARPVLIGASVGLIVGALLVQLLASFIYGIALWDPLTYAMVPSLLALVGIIAAWVPARRATLIHPQQALHYE